MAALLVLLVLATAPAASGYSWPIRPFHKAHAIRGAFDDPRFHMGAEGALSAFHFGVDIAARDGTAVFAVAPGYVRRRESEVSVRRKNGRAFGYWHIRPVVRGGQHVRRHQLLGYVLPGSGHVHFAEAFKGAYRNPLRKGALTPFRDRTPPTVGSIGFVSSGGSSMPAGQVRGLVDVQAEVWDTPPVAPRPPWQVARLTPAFVWWRLMRGGEAVTDWNIAIDFHLALMPGTLYNQVYAAGSYQNKANRPGKYLFWIVHAFDTTSIPDGSYQLQVLARDTRQNDGHGAIDFTIANGAPPVPPSYAPGMWSRFKRAT